MLNDYSTGNFGHRFARIDTDLLSTGFLIDLPGRPRHGNGDCVTATGGPTKFYLQESAGKILVRVRFDKA